MSDLDYGFIAGAAIGASIGSLGVAVFAAVALRRMKREMEWLKERYVAACGMVRYTYDARRAGIEAATVDSLMRQFGGQIEKVSPTMYRVTANGSKGGAGE